MSNEDIADALYVDEDDMAQLATQNELFKLIGVKDGDPRYSDVLLIADWHTRKLNEAVREAFVAGMNRGFDTLIFDEEKAWKEYEAERSNGE